MDLSVCHGLWTSVQHGVRRVAARLRRGVREHVALLFALPDVRASAPRPIDRRPRAGRGERIAELGSGPGHFLSMLCDAGVVGGVRLRPELRRRPPRRTGARRGRDLDRPVPDRRIPARPAWRSASMCSSTSTRPGCCARCAAGGGVERSGVVYSEVPNGQLMIEQCALVGSDLRAPLVLRADLARPRMSPCRARRHRRWARRSATSSCGVRRPGPEMRSADAEPDADDGRRAVAAARGVRSRAPSRESRKPGANWPNSRRRVPSRSGVPGRRE